MKKYVILRSDMAMEDEKQKLETVSFEEDDFMKAVTKYNEWCEWGGSVLLIDTETSQILKQCIHHIGYADAERHYVSIS